MDTHDVSTSVDDIERDVAFELIRGRLFAGSARPVAIGRFVVTGRAGQGGMGVVYAAYDPQLDRRVAVKVVRDLGRDAAEIERARRSLEREARAAAGLGHPNVVTIYDSGSVGDAFYVAMEYVDGPTLRQWLVERPRPWTEILGMLVAAGRGLQAAHAANLVHCDFKPENVLVGRDGRARVADFGLVRSTVAPPSLTEVHGPTGRSTQETSLTIAGTLRYMAPEQLATTELGPGCDQFAYCVTLYEALFGAHPYPSRSDPRLADVREGRLGKAHERTRVPRVIVRAIVRGLRREPSARHPSMQALVDELERALRRRSLARWGLVAAGAAGLAAATGYALAGTPVDRCEHSAAAIEAQWSEPIRASVFASLASTTSPHQAQVVVDRLTAYTGSWSRMRREACEATHHRGEQSAELLELRMACLDRALHSFSGTNDRLRGAAAGGATVDPRMIEWLPAVERCAAEQVRTRLLVRNAHRGTTDRSRDSYSDHTYLEVARQLDDARLESLVGHRAQARALAAAAEQGARASGLRDLEAEAALLRVSLQVDDGRTQDSEAELRRALALAVEADDAHTAAQVVVTLLRLERQGGPKVANRALLMELGHAWAARTGRAPLLAAELELERSADAKARHEHDEAIALADRALLALAAEGHVEHTVVDKLHMIRAQALLEAGRLPLAELELSTLLAHQRRRLPAGHADLGDTGFQLAEVLRLLGRVDEALPLVEEAQAIYAKRFGPHDARSLSAHRTLAEIRQAKGDFVEAARAFEAIIAEHQRSRGSFHVQQAVYLSELAELEHEVGELARAHVHALLAMTIAAKALGREHPVPVAIGITLGKVALDRGDLGLARTLLTEAHERLAGAQHDPAWAAEAAFHLARLAMLATPPDRQRARALGDEALEGFQRASGANAERFTHAITRWRASLDP